MGQPVMPKFRAMLRRHPFGIFLAGMAVGMTVMLILCLADHH
jgi:hypothetical protein